MAQQFPAHWTPERKRRARLMDRASNWAARHQRQLKSELWRAYTAAEARALEVGDNPSKTLVDAQEAAFKALPK